MKRITETIIALSVSAMALASCNKDVLPGRTSFSPGEIRFRDEGVTVTKAFAEATNTTLQTAGFNVAAVVDNDNTVMFNKAVSYSGGVYSVSGEHYYFPASGTMSFYAVYPKTQTITVTNGAATLSYSQNADTDIIAAKRTAVSKTDDAVSLTFGHLLSQASFTAKGDQDGVDFKIKSIKVTAANGGTYSFADGKWTPSGTTGDYPVISSAKTVGSTKTAVGSPMSFLPGTAKLNVVWECYPAGGTTPICENDVTKDIQLPKGVNSEINITFPGVAEEMILDVSLLNWTAEGETVTVIKDASATFSVSSQMSVSLPVATLSANSTVSIDWGDGFCETYNTVSPQKIFLEHSYTSAYSGNVNIAVYNGSLNLGEVPGIYFQRFTVNDSQHFLITEREAFKFKFTVDAFGSQVEFAPGNLFWDGASLQFESRQYDFPTKYNANHVNQFFWDKNVGIAMANDYDESVGSISLSDKFFADDGGAVEGYDMLPTDQWFYLLTHSLVTDGEMTIVDHYGVEINNPLIVNIAGKNCVILKPDGFSGTVSNSYTAEQWADAEAQDGLVALPFAGESWSGGAQLEKDEVNTAGWYWTGTPGISYLEGADMIYMYPNSISITEGDWRGEVCSVRLVKYLTKKTRPLFTVNASGKKVRFAPGNLRYSLWSHEAQINLEDHESGSYFFWSKDASIAIADDYIDDSASTSDTFFAADGGAVEGWTVLSNDEWAYVIANHLGKNVVSIDGTNCTVLVPDGFSGTVADSYTYVEWMLARNQYGLVALPLVGYEFDIGASIGMPGFSGRVSFDDANNYWTSTPNSSDSKKAYIVRSIESGDTENIMSEGRFYACQVRLVQVQ